MSAKVLMVFCDVTDLWKNEELLYEAIVRKLHKQGILGATVLVGVMGYGVHRRIHKRGLLGVSDEKPVVIFAIDQEQKLRDVLPIIVPMVKEGMINLVDTEIISMGTSRPVIEKEQSQGKLETP
jgi:PII-like signaling protein